MSKFYGKLDIPIYLLLFNLILFPPNKIGAQDINYSQNRQYHLFQFKTPVKFASGIFLKETDFSNAGFHYIAEFDKIYFHQAADFSHAHFFSDAIFENTRFRSRANFSVVKFDSTAYFLGAYFGSDAEFRSAYFVLYADFRESLFHSKANFSEIRVDSTAEFEGLQVYSNANFTGAYFNSSLDFTYALFRDTVDFTFTHFHSKVVFNRANFYSHTYFSFGQFDSDVNFQGTRFNSKADFNGAQFLRSINFENSTLPDTLIFSSIVKINNECDLTVCKLDPIKKAKNKDYKCLIDLTKSDINKIKINYELFKLFFQENETYEIKISTYEKLLKKFKDDSFLNSYELLDIEYKSFKNQSNGDNFTNWVSKNWWNYGYNKWLVFQDSFVLFGIFCIINFFLFDKLQNEIYKVKFPFRTYFPNFYSTIFNSLIYTLIIFFGFKITLENFKKINGWTFYIWIIYLSGLICLAYMLNVVIVK
jgi:uncharacterized protein YjbI with pentapeptide repeats